jgi:hypothetical protein
MVPLKLVTLPKLVSSLMPSFPRQTPRGLAILTAVVFILHARCGVGHGRATELVVCQFNCLGTPEDCAAQNPCTSPSADAASTPPTALPWPEDVDEFTNMQCPASDEVYLKEGGTKRYYSRAAWALVTEDDRVTTDVDCDGLSAYPEGDAMPETDSGLPDPTDDAAVPNGTDMKCASTGAVYK